MLGLLGAVKGACKEVMLAPLLPISVKVCGSSSRELETSLLVVGLWSLASLSRSFFVQVAGSAWGRLPSLPLVLLEIHGSNKWSTGLTELLFFSRI